jgi:hypothetical protein
MIKGATLLINGIPGRFIDPFRVAESQSATFSGYVLIAYATDCRSWDALFLQGRAVSESARIDELERRPVEPKDVEDRFNSLRERSRVFLFEAALPVVDPFTRTVRSAPALKVQVDPLSREQLVRLIRNIPSPHLLAERHVMQQAYPLYEFLEIKSPHQPIEFQMRFRKGTLMLYRIEESGKEGAQLHLALEGNDGDGAPELPARVPLLEEFTRKLGLKAAACLGEKGEALLPLEPTATVFGRIPAVVNAAGAFRRGRLRRDARDMLGELYSEKYDQLKAAGLLPQVESCYRQLKG